MNTTSPIIRYKQKLMSSIINSPELISLLDKRYVVNGECVDVDEGLVYKQIFPFYYIPDTQTEKLSYIILKVDGLGIRNKLYNKAKVCICVISHQDCMKVENGRGTRIDLIAEIIEDMFNGRDDFGFGEMELKTNIESSINDKHRCRILDFVVEDFNANACKNS